MSAPVFLVERARLLVGERVVLDGPEGRHAATVRRLGLGEAVLLTDGAGLSVDALVVTADRDRLELAVRARRESPPPQPRLVVVQALPKGDRGERAVEMLTEVGADAVVPWAASRCVTQWRGERARRSLERWRTTARAAAKQSRRDRFPEVTEACSSADVAALLAAAALGVVLHEEATESVAAVALPTSGDVVVVVGPEGGVSLEELATFAAAGASSYRLGPTVLRTSTAGPAALAVLLSRTARWSQPPAGPDRRPT